MSHSVFIFAALTLVLISCAKVPTSEVKQVDIDRFASLLERSFETAPDNKDNNIRDKRIRVNAEALDGYWFYTQLNTGEARKLYRQRLSHIELSEDDTAIIQIAYGLNEPEKYADAWTRPELLNSLTPDDFKSYFTEGCEQIWRPDDKGGWTGYVDPKSCVIASKRRNKDIRIESEAYLSQDIYRTNERGYDMDMTFLWGTEPGEYIDLFPVP